MPLDVPSGWGPAAVTGLLALLGNQWANWHKERRSDRLTDDQLEAASDARYQTQMDGVITALERRMKMAEESEAACLKRQTAQDLQMASLRQECEGRIKAMEDMVSNLSRRLALAKGE